MPRGESDQRMLVVHVSRTPLAGSPIRIVRALNAHTDVRPPRQERAKRGAQGLGEEESGPDVVERGDDGRQG